LLKQNNQAEKLEGPGAQFLYPRSLNGRFSCGCTIARSRAFCLSGLKLSLWGFQGNNLSDSNNAFTATNNSKLALKSNWRGARQGSRISD
jgi:hypothetical protein